MIYNVKLGGESADKSVHNLGSIGLTEFDKLVLVYKRMVVNLKENKWKIQFDIIICFSFGVRVKIFCEF